MIHGERGVAMNEQKQEGALAEGARRANGAKAPGHRSERGRFSCQRAGGGPASFAGREPGPLCRELGTTAARLSAWREAFLRGGEAALKARPADERENARLKAKVRTHDGGRGPAGEDDRLEAGRPLAGRRWRRSMQARFTSTGRAYGLKRVFFCGCAARRSPFMNAPRPISAALWARAPMRGEG